MAMDVPPIRYARRPDGVTIAHQVFGDGPRDLIYVPGFISHLELMWVEPGFVRFMERLSSFARVIFFDKPGTGLSDPLGHVPTVEERADDIRCVLEAAGSSRAVVMGFSEGGATAAFMAASRPDLVERLILYGAAIRFVLPEMSDAAALGMTADEMRARLPVWESSLELVRSLPDHWGEGRVLGLFAPSLLGSAVQRRLAAVLERSAASPGMARALVQAVLQVDVTSVLPAIRTNTLVLHRTDDVVPVEFARLAARMIPQATLVELPGQDHAFWLGDGTPALDAIEEFVTDAPPTRTVGRALATVMFSDIVGSTERAHELGDAQWALLLQRHDDIARREILERGGRVVKSTGDGVLATFDGPARALRAAEALRQGVQELGLRVKVGIHTGECEVGTDDIGGMAVNIAARVLGEAAPEEILVSGTVRDLVVGSDLEFSDRGLHQLKGVPGEWRLYALGGCVGPARPVEEAQGHLRLGDRAVLQIARRMPRAARLTNRLTR